jgi:hypothetical protein
MPPRIPAVAVPLIVSASLLVLALEVESEKYGEEAMLVRVIVIVVIRDACT